MTLSDQIENTYFLPLAFCICRCLTGMDIMQKGCSDFFQTESSNLSKAFTDTMSAVSELPSESVILQMSAII